MAPLLPDLVRWLQDLNWPGATIIADFLVTVGEPVVPHIKRVLRETDDTIWHYWLLNSICSYWPKDWIMSIEPELRQVVAKSDLESASAEASQILGNHGMSPNP